MIDKLYAEFRKRNEKIYAEVLAGKTMTSVAKKHGISVSRVSWICAKIRRRRKWEEARHKWEERRA
jgi:DNA-binding CsgD family transcriptional regulator